MTVEAANLWTSPERGESPAGGMAPRLLSVKQVALRVGLSRSAVYAMIEDGRLPALALGEGKRPRIRIDERELEAWLYGELS